MRRTVLALAALACVASAKTFTLEQVLSAPFPSELTASPSGNRVAWVLNERGARNVWIASAPDWKGARVTSYTVDDGQDLGQLHWTPDGNSVVYVHGGDLEFLGRPDPNPAMNPAGVEQAIWLVAPGQSPRKIAVGHSPAVSPKGDRIAYLLGGQVWTASLAGSEAPSMLVHARSGATASDLVWSPDGNKVAFVSTRTDHSFIAIYDFTAKTLGYLDPSTDRDSSPAWSPDSRQVAFIRNVSGSTPERGARRSGEPWAICVATVADGAGRQIWKAEAGPGSVFHAMVSEQQLYWGAGGRILFPWEHDGWLHLYSVAMEGGPAALLTPGNFEIEHVALTHDGKEAIFSSNQDDIDRRHIWHVSIAEGPPTAITKGEELEWTPVPAAGGVAFLHADGRRPARAAILIGGKVRDLAPESIPADFPADSLVAPQQVIYPATDGMQIHAQLFLPPNSRPGERHKALVFMHGGSRRQMLLGWHYMDYYNNAYGMNQYLASQGYVVLSINYRSGIGYGMEFREALNYGATGASEYQDVEGAGKYLRTRDDVDPAHIGLWGGSYGGYLTALGLARNSDLFAAGVDFHGVHDWSARLRAGAGQGNGEASKLAFESSPMASVKTWKSPVLLIHGDDDRNVDFSQTVELAAALRKQNNYFEELIIPDEIHGFLRHASWLKAYHREVDFFGRKL
jgi:dipeptidyl aminopeptidase/acylaminoacyl peptidase